MSLQISNVHYVNFGPFEDAKVCFNEPGLTVIEGVISDKASRKFTDSNGCGKSFLLDGPVWAVWDRCLRSGYEGERAVRRELRDGAHVQSGATSVSVQFAGDEAIEVVRYRNHPKYKNQLRLTVNGKDRSRGTNDETTKAIERILGLDFSIFRNAVAFGVKEDAKGFFSAADADRKRILDRMLNLDIYVQAEVIAKARRDELEETAREIELAISTLKIRLESKTEDAKALEKFDIEKAEADYKEKKSELAILQKRIVKLTEDSRMVEVACDAALLKRDMLRKEHDLKQRDYLAERSELERKKLAAGREEARVTALLNELSSRTNAVSNMSGGVCPTCGQDVSKSHVDSIENASELEVEKLRKKQASSKKQFADADAMLRSLKSPVIPKDVDDDYLAERDKVAESKAQLNHVKSDHRVMDADLKAIKGQIDSWKNERKEIQESIESMNGEWTELELKVSKAKAELDIATFWVTGFGPRGIRSFLIEAELPEINRLSTVYAQRLLGAGTRVRLSATTALKTKSVEREKISVDLFIPGKTDSFAGASRGQKQRLDLSLILAFRKLVADRSANPFNQFFADELFDGLDRTGVPRVAELLQEISEDCPVTLVTHDARLKVLADRVITVTHDGVKANVTVV